MLCDENIKEILKNLPYLVSIVGFTKEPTGVRRKNEDNLEKYGVDHEYFDFKTMGWNEYGSIYWPYKEDIYIELSFSNPF